MENQQRQPGSADPAPATAPAAMESNHRPWQDILLPLAEKILERLPLPDYVRFAAVCPHWRSVQLHHRLRHHPSPPPMIRLPWLIPSVRAGLSLAAALSPFEPQPKLYPFHSTTTNRRGTLLGVSHGWLLLFAVASDKFRLVNPVSGAEIQIPSPSLRILPVSGLLSAPPTHLNGFTVMLRSVSHLILWRSGHDGWTVLPGFSGLGTAFTMSIRSVISCGGKFYMECFNHKRFFFVDPHRPAPAVEVLDCAVMPRDDCRADFLVDLDGQLLMVRVVVEKKRKVKDGRTVGGFEVFRAEKTWERMEGLGDRALFISKNCSFSLAADGAGGVRENYIYFLESILEDVSSEELPLWKGYDLGTETMIEGPPFPSVADGYDWSQFRSGLQWMMPEPGVMVVQDRNQADTGSAGNSHGATTNAGSADTAAANT